MFLRLSALVLLSRFGSALTTSCNGLFGPECIPAKASGAAVPSSGSTANTVEYFDIGASWRRTDLTASLWTSRGVDDWLVNFVATHPTLKTSGRFYQELASITNLDLQGSCNLDLQCWVAAPSTGATTDVLNAYLVLSALTNLNDYMKVVKTENWNSFTALGISIPQIRADFKPATLQKYMKNPEPKAFLQLAAKGLGSIPVVGPYIGGAVSALTEIIVKEPFKDVDLDLAQIQNSWAIAMSQMQDAYDAAFQQVMNGDPTAEGGAIRVLKGGNLVKSFSAEISNTRVIYKKIHQTHINQFVNMLLDYYRIWINAGKYSSMDMCDWFKINVYWNLPGEVCMDEGFHVFPVNFEASSFYSVRGQFKYEPAANFPKWIDQYQLYRESIACDANPKSCSKFDFTLQVVRNERCLNAYWLQTNVSPYMKDSPTLDARVYTNGLWTRADDNYDKEWRKASIYCANRINAVLMGVCDTHGEQCIAKQWIKDPARKGNSGSNEGRNMPCLPGWKRHYNGIGEALPDILKANYTYPASWGL